MRPENSNILSKLRALVTVGGVGLSVLATGVGSPVYAQSDSPIEEITVTATRRATSALDTGVSLSAITEDRLEREGYDSFADFATSVAGLSFGQRGPGQSIIVLRGVNSSTTQFNTDEPEAKATVGVYLDDTPVSLGGYNPDPRLFDINRIEVLRGPQGTLFGAGSMSGTIRYITNAPDPSGLDSKISMGYSNTEDGGNNLEFDGMLNVPLGDIAAARATVFRRDVDGFIDNAGRGINPANPFAPSELEDVNTDETNGGRLQFLLEPTDNLSLTARAYFQRTHTGGYPTIDIFDTTRPRDTAGGGGNNPADATLGDRAQDRAVGEDATDEFALFNFDIDYTMDFAELTAVTSYMRRELDQNFEQTDFIALRGFVSSLVGPLNNNTVTEDWVQEVRLVSHGASDFQWIFGVFYNQQDKKYIQDSPAPAAAGIANNNVFRSAQDFDERQWAIFGEASYELTDSIKAIVGLRYYDYKQDMIFTPIPSLFSSRVNLNTTLKEDGINPKFSVEWRPLDDTLVYATAAKGFRLGGTSDPLPVANCGEAGGTPIDSDSLWNYEVGYKKDAERYNFSAAAYFIEWEDAPVTAAFACGFGTTVNGPKIQSIGLEAETTFALTDDFILNANAGYTNAEFKDNFTKAGLTVNDGTEAPLVPKFAFNLGANYYFPVAGYEAYVGANYSWQGSRFNQANVGQRVKMDDYGLLNINAGIDFDQIRINAFVRNLTDEQAVIFKDNIFLHHNRDTITRPRTLGVSAIYRF